MKVVAIIDVPEGGKGKWYIDGEIRYTENESLMKKFDKEMIPLKPFPTRPDIIPVKNEKDYVFGWNDCLDEITGETE